MFFKTGVLLLLTSAFFVIVTFSSTIKTSDIKGSCPLNEEPTDCVEYCAPTCDRPKSPVCIGSCRPGCNCKDGFIRETAFGKCVQISSCVNPEEIRRNYTEPCKDNEVISDCAVQICEAYCEFPQPVACSVLWCPRGCVCKDGYIRKTSGGVCVPRSSC